MSAKYVLCLAAAVGATACSIELSVFSDGEPISGSGAGGPTTGQGASTTTAVGGSTGPAQGGSGATAAQGGFGAQGGSGAPGGFGAQGGVGAQGGSGAQGGAPACDHDVCVEGGPLVSGCDACATSVCNADPFCCDMSWDDLCTYQVLDVCGLDCAPALPDCTSQHMGAPGFQLCGQNADVCDIAFNGATTSCAAICDAAGTECIEAVNNSQGPCGHGQEIGCNAVGYNSAVCVCSRGCGSGQPCAATASCEGGVCVNN